MVIVSRNHQLRRTKSPPSFMKDNATPIWKTQFIFVITDRMARNQPIRFKLLHQTKDNPVFFQIFSVFKKNDSWFSLYLDATFLFLPNLLVGWEPCITVGLHGNQTWNRSCDHCILRQVNCSKVIWGNW